MCILKIKWLGGWGFSSVVERLPSNRKALGLVPSSEKKNQKKKKKKKSWDVEKHLADLNTPGSCSATVMLSLASNLPFRQPTGQASLSALPYRCEKEVVVLDPTSWCTSLCSLPCPSQTCLTGEEIHVIVRSSACGCVPVPLSFTGSYGCAAVFHTSHPLVLGAAGDHLF